MLLELRTSTFWIAHENIASDILPLIIDERLPLGGKVPTFHVHPHQDANFVLKPIKSISLYCPSQIIAYNLAGGVNFVFSRPYPPSY